MSLKDFRNKIDGIDAKIVALLNDRAKLSQLIGKEKLRENKPIYSPAREKEVLRRIKDLNKGPLSADALQAIYQEIYW
jgi:chorismate mutase/prephenate dehydratase